MTLNPENLENNDDTQRLLSNIEEIAVGPFVYCGIYNNDPVFMYSGDKEEAIHTMCSFLSTLMYHTCVPHTLDEGWVNYVRAFFLGMGCKDAVFIMKDNEDKIYYAVNGTRRNVAHALIESIEFLYGDCT